MARGINKVILIGNLGADPELRFTPAEVAVCNMSVATSATWKDKDGNRQEKTEWHRVVLFQRQAEVAGEYLKKGSKVYIEGRLQTRKWQGQDGQDRYTAEVIANEMQMLDQASGGSSSRPAGRQANPRQDQPPPNDDLADDIPF